MRTPLAKLCKGPQMLELVVALSDLTEHFISKQHMHILFMSISRHTSVVKCMSKTNSVMETSPYHVERGHMKAVFGIPQPTKKHLW